MKIYTALSAQVHAAMLELKTMAKKLCLQLYLDSAIKRSKTVAVKFFFTFFPCMHMQALNLPPLAQHACTIFTMMPDIPIRRCDTT